MAIQNPNSEQDNGDDSKLIAKVDEMMSPDRPSKPMQAKAQSIKIKISDQPQTPSPPPLDIFAETPSAPLLSRKNIKDKPLKEPASKSVPVLVESPTKTVAEPEPVVDTPPSLQTVNEYDDPQTAALVDQIVASEAKPIPEQRFEAHKKSSKVSSRQHQGRQHPLLWVLVILICILAGVTVLYLSDPAFHLPLRATKQLFDRLTRRV